MPRVTGSETMQDDQHDLVSSVEFGSTSLADEVEVTDLPELFVVGRALVVLDAKLEEYDHPP